jgi:putative intracellular protease/amidase
MRWRTIGRLTATVFLALVVTGAVGAVGIAGATGEIYTARGPSAPPVLVEEAAVPTHDPAKPTAVILLGPEVANAADVLAPYEVLAATGAFNLYTVAPQRQPVPLTGGLDLVPDLSLGQLDQRLPTGPEVIVVPQLSEVAAGLPPSVAPIIEWLQRQRADGDPLLVGVCVGAQVLAEAGLLDGRPATSHWLGLIGHRRDYPQVRWTDGVRYVDDGDLITTGGVLSGVDGALRVIERMVGPAAAARAAQAVHWPAYSPGAAAPIERSRPAPADLVAVLSAGYRWDRPTMGVLLTDGVGETELAAAFRPYTELSYLARPLAVTTDGRPVRSRHGLTFLPRAELAAAAPGLDRLLVPGADAARREAAEGLPVPEGLAPVYLHQQPGFAFDAALGDIARTRDVATARWVAKTLQYPTLQYPTRPRLAGPAWPWTLTLRPILLAAATVAAVLGVGFLGRRRRGAFRGGDRAAPPAQPADTSSNAEPSSQLTRRRS